MTMSRINNAQPSNPKAGPDSITGNRGEVPTSGGSGNSLDTALARIRASGRIGLMIHMIVGYPSLEESVPLAVALEEGGADILELQIPFSDPIADGPTIMQACDAALKAGTTVERALDAIDAITRTVKIPTVIMAYYNTVFSYGTERFCTRAASMGVSGLIVPDIPPEEESHERFMEHADAAGVYPIRVVSPASSGERLALNASLARGFLYSTSRFGVTGASGDLDPRLAEYVDTLRTHFSVPIAIGFGIATPEHVRALAPMADIAIVGSAIVERISPSGKEDADARDARHRRVRDFVLSLSS
jgi:tryptophan synthase alpha subunit